MRKESIVQDGMAIDWDVPIVADDGLVLRADVYRPVVEGRYPVILSYGPYGKGLAFQDGYETAWKIMVDEHPDVLKGSTNKYQSWEVVDPEKWVPDDYVVVRVDSRGAGRSPGYLDPFSRREIKDFYDCIEWAAVQPWSNGKVGLNGISYYAVNQWAVAALKPPHLVACCIWEGHCDWYREANHHGGIYSTFHANWWDMQVEGVQYGMGDRGPISRITGETVCGSETLSKEELADNRCNYSDDVFGHSLIDAYHRERSGSETLGDIEVPILSCGNWGGNGLHLRGNIEGYLGAASEKKWLEMHGDRHWSLFYTDYGIDLQKRFLNHFLKGEVNGWDQQPGVQLQIRHVDGTFTKRFENEWPIARTQWTKFYMDLAQQSLTTEPISQHQAIEFKALGDGVTFLSAPLEADTEITGPSAAKLFVASSTTDADMFLILQVFAPDGKEVVFVGALDPHTPVGQGWLRASHRELDQEKSTPYRPYHPHTDVQPLTPGEVVELDIEIWPTCVVVPRGYRIGLSVRGKDYEYSGATGGKLSNMKNEFTGCGPFLHDSDLDRPRDTFGGITSINGDFGRDNYVLLPIVPAKLPRDATC